MTLNEAASSPHLAKPFFGHGTLVPIRLGWRDANAPIPVFLGISLQGNGAGKGMTREDKQDRPYGPRGITTLVALRLVDEIGVARLGVDVGFRSAPNAGRGRGYG